MSRVDNSVMLVGKVVKGPIVKYIEDEEGKQHLRVGYQVQIQGRAKDKGNVQAPFIRSTGNQAEKDKENIKTGDMVIVEGRLITRLERKKLFFIKDQENQNNLIPIDPDDEEGPIYDDEDLYTATVVRPVTEVVASDVWYFSKFVDLLGSDERKKLFGPRVLRQVLAEKGKSQEEIDEILTSGEV